MSLNGAKVGIIHPGPPATCGGVMASELTRCLRKKANIEEIFIERRRKCRRINWRMPPDRIVEHRTKYFAFYQINNRLPRYDIYHYLSERHARLLRYDRKPAVVTIHDAAPLRTSGVYTDGTKRRFRKNVGILLEAQAVVANTKNARKDLVELFGINENRVEVIYPGVNHDIYSPRDRMEIRKLLGLPENARIILNVGNENKNNNIPLLIEVLSLVRRKYPEVVLLRVGPTGPQVDKAIEQFAQEEAVIRAGAGEGSTTLYNYFFNASDLYVCLDHYTGYSIQGLSAMASGCPVVSSRPGGFSEIAAGCARFVNHNDKEEIAEVLLELLRDDQARKRLSEEGLHRSREFTWEKTARSCLEIYKRVLNELRSARKFGQKASITDER